MLRLNGRPIVEMGHDEIGTAINKLAPAMMKRRETDEAFMRGMVELVRNLSYGVVTTPRELSIMFGTACTIAGLLLDGHLSYEVKEDIPVFEIGADGNLDIPEAFLRAFPEDEEDDNAKADA